MSKAHTREESLEGNLRTQKDLEDRIETYMDEYDVPKDSRSIVRYVFVTRLLAYAIKRNSDDLKHGIEPRPNGPLDNIVMTEKTIKALFERCLKEWRYEEEKKFRNNP